MSDGDKWWIENKARKMSGEAGAILLAGGGAVREGLTEKVTLQQRAEGDEEGAMWMSGGECCRQHGTCKSPEMGLDCLPNRSGCVLQ